MRRSEMKLCIFLVVIACIHRDGSDGLPAQIPQGPPIPLPGQQFSVGEPQPPSIDGILLELKAPAPPPEHLRPKPPAPPDPVLLELFNKNPDAFPAAYAELQSMSNKRERRAGASSTKRRSPTYDQFITAAIVTGLNLQQRSAYTFFAPSDSFLRSSNISLSIMALKDMECVRHIVRSHTVLGRLSLSQGVEDVALSLSDAPVFFNSREVNGVEIERANIEADYGLVHIVNGWLMDNRRMSEICPSLVVPSSREGLQGPLTPSSSNLEPYYSVSLPNGLLPAGLDQHSSSIKANDINDLFDDEAAGPHVVVPFAHNSNDDPSSSEANVDVLLSNIDNFATAWAKMSDEEDSVITTLQGLGASTFLALLERSNLMDTLTNDGPWTVFAPDNNAWQALPPASFDHIMKDPVLLKQILSYHIVPANMTRRSLSNGQKLSSLNEGHPIHINLYSDGWASWYSASGSMITNLDEMSGNGVVHVVQSVLFPPLGDLNSVVKWTPALQTSFEWLEAANLTSSAGLTAFLPEDSPMLAASLAQLSPSELSDVWKRHLVRGTWFASGLIDGDRLETVGGDILFISHRSGCVTLNGACILVRDITLTNGVLHVVDKLL